MSVVPRPPNLTSREFICWVTSRGSEKWPLGCRPTGVSRVLIAIALKCALMMKFFARAREMAWHAVNGVVDGYYGVSLGYLRNLEVGL